jgi:hypothetical protein
MFLVKEAQLINQFSNQTIPRGGVVFRKLMVVQLAKIPRLL